MANPHGSFIWYELLTSDAGAAAEFYGDVVGWAARGAGMDGVDYRLFSADDGGDVAGFMTMPAEMAMPPGWIGYIGVDDVDAAVDNLVAAGGAVHMPAMDMEGVGRMAMVADPQGAIFYLMRGASEEASRSFAPSVRGHACWNELSTSDQPAALAFYTAQYGWTKGDVMPMGEMGDYQFIDHRGEMIGAVMRAPQDAPTAWNFCFNTGDIDAAAARVTKGGGSIHYGPAEIPGGDFVINATDPQGAAFMLRGARK
ncbi:MAG: VOC family protein [Pseudomonadota bacterium]|nr:VOC family protein [Pseudomonadota bacterium]